MWSKEAFEGRTLGLFEGIVAKDVTGCHIALFIFLKEHKMQSRIRYGRGMNET
jgi:hypothetical protein